MRRLILIISLILSPALNAAMGDINTLLLSPTVLVGERTELLIRVEGTDRAFLGQIPKTDGLKIDLKETTSPSRGPIRDTLFRLTIRPLQEGSLEIPALPIEILGKQAESQPVLIQSISPTALTWQKKQIQELELQYATRWSLPKQALYAGESIPVSLHLYLPNLAGTAEAAYPRDQSQGLAVTPLLPVDPYKPAQYPVGQTLLRGLVYDVFVFSARATAIAGGKLTLGPAIIPSSIKVRRMEKAQMRNFELETTLEIPAINLTGLPFPVSPPGNFSGAIGEFNLSARLPSQTLTPRAPIELELTVEGRGNFADLPPPALLDPGEWKVVSVRRLGEASSHTSSPARFQYLLTHPATPTSLPQLQLTSFSPLSEKFETSQTPSIPLRWSGSTSPGPNKLTPSPTAPDADAVSSPFAPIAVNPSSPRLNLNPSPPFWWNPIVGITALLPLVALLGLGFRRRHLLRHPESEVLEELRKIPLNSPSVDYLRQLGSTLERSLPEEKRPTTAIEILKLRDQHCFSPEPTNFDLPKSQRKQWLKELSQSISILALIAFLSLLLCPSSQAESAPNGTTGSLPSSHQLTNQGSHHAELGDWPQAAKALRQAIAADPTNQEARVRLDLVHQSANAILPQANFWQDSLARLPRQTYLQSACLALIAALYALTLRYAYGRYKRPLVTLGLSLIFISGLAFWIYQQYPSLRSLRTLSNLAVVTSETELRQLPLDSAPATYLPPSTPVQIQAERGAWLLVQSPEPSESSKPKTYWVKENSLLRLDQ